MSVIPFYGVDRPQLFSIERRAMDRPGRLIGAIDALLPASGLVVDVGAGDGFTAERLTTPDRVVIAAEPAWGMVKPDRGITWVQAEAEFLPFGPATFDAAYATWAYFFSRGFDPEPGLLELHRVVKPGGRLLIADNLGSDEFTALASSDITSDVSYWESQRFECQAIDTLFEFDSLDEAITLLAFYFGDEIVPRITNPIGFRVGLFSGFSSGPRSGIVSATDGLS